MATDFLDLTKQAYDASCTYFDANVRDDLDYGLRAFRNEHAANSKYNSDEFKARSHLFRPKTRSIIRKNEAAAAVALFSNMDVVNITAGNVDDPMSVASASAMKEILEYRLSKTIPAFPLVMGGVQDAQASGAVCSYQYWEYAVKPDGRKVRDKPCIELRPLENIRLDYGANWLDPVNTSPYWCDIIPMYVCDVKAMMNNDDPKTGAPKWKKFDDSMILQAKPDAVEMARNVRNGQKENPMEKESAIKAFDQVWVMRWFMKDALGDDYTYYTLGTSELLTKALPIDEVYFHGRRPYVMGCAIIETHKAHKTSLPMLVKPLQQETNDVANQRIDNVKFVLNKRWLVARGRQVDVNSLIRNQPGGVTMLTDPKNDVVESNWPDVTSSAYVEQDRINADFDDVAGNFSPSTKVANNAVNDTLGGSRMAAQGAGVMTDYMLRTIIETWWEPVLRQLVLLEQYYETDEVVLSVCAKKARLFPRFGISQITDDMLMNEVNLTVNVGMGSSNPSERFQRFMIATKAATELVATAPPGFNVQEGIKEIYSNAGYRDGARFFDDRQDPRLVMAMQQIQKMQQALEGKQMELAAQQRTEMLKIQSGDNQKKAQLMVDYQRIHGDMAIRQAEIEIENARLQLDAMKIAMEIRSDENVAEFKLTEAQLGIQQEQLKIDAEQQKMAGQAMKMAAEIEKAQMEIANVKSESDNEGRISEVANNVSESMRQISESMSGMMQAMNQNGNNIGEMNKGLGAMFGLMMQPKKKAKAFNLIKPDGKKTSSVSVMYDDGSSEELSIN